LAAARELFETDKKQTEIAEDHGVTPAAVSQWKSTLETEGTEGLKSTNDEGNQGPDSQLDDQDREQLVELLEEGAQSHGWETDLWTSSRVTTLIKDEFDIDYTPRHCSRILRELGYRPVKPREGDAEKDPEEKERWARKKMNILKKLTDGETILCIDESPYRHVPVTTERWAKEETYPTISPGRGDWRKVSAIGAVTLWLGKDETFQTKGLW
jgi:transposase